MPDIRMPDGVVVRFPDTMSREQIRGLIAHKFPREVGQAGAEKAVDDRDATGHYAFDESGIEPRYDASKSFVSGVRRGVEELVGLPGTLGELASSGAQWLATKAGASPETVETVGTVARLMGPGLSSDQIRDNLTDPLVGPGYQPKTTAGEFAGTMGEFATGAFVPGGMVRQAATMAAPALASETAGQFTEGTSLEPWARLGGAVVGGGAAAIPSLGRRSGKAMTQLVKDMQAAGRTPDEINAALARLGDEAAPIDLPEFRQRGQRIYARGGEGRQTISQFLRPRAEGANQRIRSTLDENLGPAPVPSQVKSELTDAQRALGPEYEAAFANARRVDTRAIADDLRSLRANVRGAQREAIDKVLKDLTIEGTEQLDPHPRALHAVREAIDGMMTSETNRKVKATLSEIRKRVDAELAAKVPGIKEVDAKYAHLKRQEEAFDRGISSLDSGRGTPRPVELADEISRGGPDIQRRIAQGQRADIDRLVGTTANDRGALQKAVKGEGDWNRAKLAMAHGQERVDPVFRRLDAETVFADTANRVMHNSATAERLTPDAPSSFGVREAAMAGGPKGAAYGVAIRLLEKAVERIGGNRIAKTDADIAKLLTTTERNQIMTALMKANDGRKVSQEQMNAFLRLAVPAASTLPAIRDAN